MKKKECPSCGVEIDEDLSTCPICHYEFPPRTRPRFKLIALLTLLLFVYPLVKILCS